jgi:hypothetical protein
MAREVTTRTHAEAAAENVESTVSHQMSSTASAARLGSPPGIVRVPAAVTVRVLR